MNDLPVKAITPEMTRHEQKDIQRAWQADIDAHIAKAQTIAAQSYEKGINAKSDMLEEVNVTRRILAMYKKGVHDYLLTDPDESTDGNTDRGIRQPDRTIDAPTKKTRRGEQRARGRMIDQLATVEKKVADTIEVLMNTQPFMGEKSINIKSQSSSYAERVNRTAGAADEIQGEVVEDSELKDITG